MKKNILVLMSLFLFFSCSDKDTLGQDKIEVNNEISHKEYIVWAKQNNYINIYGNILNNNIKTLSSKINWKISYLECETWKKVNKNTLIAKITPDTNDLSYKNNIIQINSLKEQLQNQENIRASTVLNFDSQLRQIKLKKEDLVNQVSVMNNNLWNTWTASNDETGIEKQIVLLNETKELLLKNKAQSSKEINDSINNLKWNIFNTATTAVKRLDEIFWISKDNKDKNKTIEDFLWAKNITRKNDVKEKIKTYLNLWYDSKEDLANFTNDELSVWLNNFSVLLKNASKVIDESISSKPNFTDAKISLLYKELIWYSDWMQILKTNFDKLINWKQTSILTFDSKIKEIDQAKETINIQKNTLSGNVDSLNFSLSNIDEQISNLLESKKSTLKKIDMQIININEWISKLNLMFQANSLYAWINWVIKSKIWELNNSVWIWMPICSIIPNLNSLKLEIYSPEILKIWDNFEYYKDNKLLWKWKIVNEYPTKNSMTQNYVYLWEIDFSSLKQWDYIDIKVIKQNNNDESEIWVPIEYIKPKWDWYYVSKKDSNNKNMDIKVIVWNMNNWEIKIISWVKFWDVLINK